MVLSVYSTLTREQEPFTTIEPGSVRMYVCGPTVYHEAHVGHAMSSIVFDLVRRYLEYKGYRVRHVMNFTDVDDKIIARASVTGEDPFALADRYARRYEEQLEALNVLPPAVLPRVSGNIAEIVSMIQGLIEGGHAYQTPGGDVYFQVRSFPDYGRLSRRRLEEAVTGTRVSVSEEKHDEGDFALWKSAKPGEPSWDSPWGLGRPGWHIECSAMSLRFLGAQIDIHGGGNDLIFPHHENEIAQTESYTGQPFARYWMHNGMLQLGGEKMSKSLGNLVTIDQFLAEHEADTLRLIIAGSGYRKPLAFNEDVIGDSERALDRLRGAFRPATGLSSAGPAAMALVEQQNATRAAFEAAMDDDFNTAGALAALFDLVRAINTARQAGVGGEFFEGAQVVFRTLSGVLGLRLIDPQALGRPIDPFVDLLLEIRRDLRQARQWQLADKIRDELKARGVIVEDFRAGQRLANGLMELLYGRHAVLETLRAGRRVVHRILLAQGGQRSGIVAEIIGLAQERRCPVAEVPRQVLERAGPVNHQGVSAEAGPFHYLALDALLAQPDAADALFLVLDHLQDVQNLGTMLRTAEAMAVTGVILPSRRSAEITPAVVNASAGAVEHLAVAQVGNLVQALETLKEAGVWVAGLDDSPGAVPLERADLSGKLALVVGAEGPGLSRLVREKCDWLLAIPMYGAVASLNASVAGSVALVAARQARGRERGDGI